MKLRTWHVEALFVWAALAGTLVAFGRAGDWREWLAALGVQLGFHHASVADRLREAEEARSASGAEADGYHVECVRWLTRYWVGKELAWVGYFVATGAVSALVGCGVFLLHPYWRQWYRARRPRVSLPTS